MKNGITFAFLVLLVIMLSPVFAQENNGTEQNETEPEIVCPPIPKPTAEVLAGEAYYNDSVLKLPLRILIKQGDKVTLQEINMTIKNIVDEQEIASNALNAEKQSQLTKLKSEYQEKEANYKQLRQKYDDLLAEKYVINYVFDDIRDLREALLKSLEAGNIEDLQVNLKLFEEELNTFNEKINGAKKRTFIQWMLQNAASILASLTLTGLIVTWIAKYYHKTKALVREKAILRAKLEQKESMKKKP